MTDTLKDNKRSDRKGIEPADQFERHRRYLMGLAYRMLGSLTEAEDAVQEAYIRWHRTEQRRVESPRAFLATIVTRLCLDQMKSARAKRETYLGPWLPEPVLDAETLSAETASDYATDLSVGLMLALARLPPLERAAFSRTSRGFSGAMKRPGVRWLSGGVHTSARHACDTRCNLTKVA